MQDLAGTSAWPHDNPSLELFELETTYASSSGAAELLEQHLYRPATAEATVKCDAASGPAHASFVRIANLRYHLLTRKNREFSVNEPYLAKRIAAVIITQVRRKFKPQRFHTITRLEFPCLGPFQK
jgi:hypothetical protein